MKSKSKAPIGASLVVLSAFFYASYGIWTKLMGDFFEGYTASALRSVLVLLMLIPLAFLYKGFEPLRIKDNWPYILGMLIASLFTWGPLYFAILNAGVSISLAVTYASIVISSFFFGWLFAKEKFTLDKAISAFLGLCGVILIFAPNNSGLVAVALAAAFLSGLSAGANIVFSKLIKYNATQSTIVLWTASVVANVIMLIILSESKPYIGWSVEWFYLVLFAIASVIASWSLVKGVKLIEAGAAGILGLMEIVFGVLFGVMFFHERPDSLALLGVGIIILAAAIPYIKDYNASKGSLA